MLKTRIKNTWKILKNEKGLSFLHHAGDVSIYEGHKLSWNNYMLENLLSYCDNTRVAIDVGASYGFVSNELATRFGEVLSSELIPEIRDCLKENMKHNLNVTVIDAGFSYYKGTQRVEFCPVITGHTGIKKNTNKKFKKTLKMCHVTTIDRLVGNRTDIDFIKIDVEGGEIKVLEGADRTLRTNDPVVLLEMHNDSNVNRDLKIIEYLWNHDYRFVARHYDDYLFKKKKRKVKTVEV